jgi:hypothetical protein
VTLYIKADGALSAILISCIFWNYKEVYFVYCDVRVGMSVLIKYSGDQIKIVMGEAFGKYGEDEWCMKGFRCET